MIIIDAEGAERDWEWVKKKYNLPFITEAPKDKDHWEVVELHEQIGNASMTVRLVGEKLVAIVFFGWPDGYVVQETDLLGQTGFGMGGGAYYRPDRGEAGPHRVRMTRIPSDIVNGLGMIGKTNHAHLEPTFQFMKAGVIEPPPPPPDYEEYISALEKIREIVNVICPLDGLE